MKTKTVKAPKVKRKLDKKKLTVLIVGGLAALVMLTTIIGLITLLIFLGDKPTIKSTDFDSKQSSQIFDQNGILIADVGETIRTNITYSDLPNSLVDAFVSVEDSRFFEHNGFDVPRFAKALLNNIATLSLSQGGSTFTMQLIDNTYFMETAHLVGKVESIKRKAQEIFLSMDAEKILNKKRILELYLNKINFGGTGNIRGVAKAAEYYFNKNISDLTLSESAMLAGIINSPYNFDPFNFLDKATNRRNVVLELMLRHGYIEENEYKLAVSIKVEDLLVDPKNRGQLGDGTPYQAYVDAVIEEVRSTTGYDPTQTPMKIYTYMDRTVQETLDKIQAGEYEGITFPDELIELGVISMNNQTGAINGVGGGRNYARGGSLLLNHATQQFKQPGSTVKPFLSYALAFEYLGWSTSHYVTDKPINYRGTDIVIKNSSNKYFGDVTLNFAFGNSLNTPAIQTLEDVVENTSRKQVVDYLKSLGFSKIDIDKFDIGYAIGGSSFEVSVKELAGAMGAMINGGSYNIPHTVSKIEMMETGDIIEPSYVPTQVISPEAAYLTSDLMYSAVYGPYYNYMQILKEDYPIYAKTGTTDYGSDATQYNIPKGAAKDIWMVGNTSEYTVATWYGYEKAIKDKETWISDSKNKANIRGKITNAVLDANHDGKSEPKAITRPSGIVDISHVLGIYPYTSTIEGMNEDFIARGKIKKEFATLADPMKASIENLADLTTTVSADGTVSTNFTPYPDASKLTIAEATKNISLSVGSIYVEAYGARLFDWSWIYGPIRYRGNIKVNDVIVNEFMSDNQQHIFKIDKLLPGDNIKVCGVYAFELMPIYSNEVCKDFKVADQEVTLVVPTETATKADVIAWGTLNGLNIETKEIKNNALIGKNLITIDSINSNGQSLTKLQSLWFKAKIDATFYISECGDNTELVNGACICLPDFEGDPLLGCSAIPIPDPGPVVPPVPPVVVP